MAALTCAPDAATLCLNNNRFRVTADWRKPDGTTGQGQAVLLTSDTGYFWFFNSTNIEIVTKVLNACADPSNAYWVFSAGLTNVEVTLRVVDTHTGALKTYLNSLNTPYQPVQDTSAFATCQQQGPTNSVTADLDLAPSTPPCSGFTEVTGIYQEGKGTYLPGDSVVWAGTLDGVDLRIKPLCSANRRLNALLPGAARALLTGPMNPCQDSGELNTIQLKIPDLQDAPTGVVGKPSLPPDYPKAQSVYFYFLVDSNHDGTFGGGDDGYNLVWQSGIYLTRTELPDRTIYSLTTDLTSPNAELFRGIGTGGVSEGVFCVPLRLTATQLK